MSARAAEVIREIDLAMETVAWSPLLVATLRHRHVDVREFNSVYSATLVGVGGWLTPREAGHIRRRAKANRKRNKAARRARRTTRG